MKKDSNSELIDINIKRKRNLYLILHEIIGELNLWQFLKNTPNMGNYTFWEEDEINRIKDKLSKRIAFYNENNFWGCLHRLKKLA